MRLGNFIFLSDTENYFLYPRLLRSEGYNRIPSRWQYLMLKMKKSKHQNVFRSIDNVLKKDFCVVFERAREIETYCIKGNDPDLIRKRIRFRGEEECFVFVDLSPFLHFKLNFMFHFVEKTVFTFIL